MSVYFYGCITLDGYLADSNHALDWLNETGSVEETTYDAFYIAMDVTIMGKKTYDAIKDMEGVEEFYGTTKNYVFTNSTEELKNGFISVQGDIVEFIMNLDREKKIWIVGGNTILAPLIQHDLVDEYIVQIAPVLLGKGIPLFTIEETVKRLKLQNVERFGEFAELHYTK